MQRLFWLLQDCFAPPRFPQHASGLLLHAQLWENFTTTNMQYKSHWLLVEYSLLHGKTSLAGLELAFASACDAEVSREYD